MDKYIPSGSCLSQVPMKVHHQVARLLPMEFEVHKHQNAGEFRAVFSGSNIPDHPTEPGIFAFQLWSGFDGRDVKVRVRRKQVKDRIQGNQRVRLRLGFSVTQTYTP